MSYRTPLDEDITFTDRYGDERTIHRAKKGQGLAVKRQRTTPAIALNQAMAGLVGARIKQFRIDQGLTLEELCVRAGLVSATPKQRMWEIENAKRREGVRLGTLYALAMALGVEVSDLMPSVAEVESIARVTSQVKRSVRVAA